MIPYIFYNDSIKKLILLRRQSSVKWNWYKRNSIPNSIKFASETDINRQQQNSL